jgi:multiple sugar transport system substrate-binding protein
MQVLEVSINNSVYDPEEICRLIREYERQPAMDVRVFDWSQAWTEFMKISIYQHGPVVSETGDTWMGSLTSRNCLRPFNLTELATFGGSDDFLGEMWQSCLDFDEKTIVAIPWSMDTYLIYYRRDLLARAGVDESTAFLTTESLTDTLDKLNRAGVEIPIAIPTGGKSNSMVHQASCWVLKRGGDFISPDGKRIIFTKPETLAGLKEYFQLFRFIPPDARFLDDETSIDAFVHKGAAIALQNPPFLYSLKNGKWPHQSLENVGIAVQPGVPFIGGSNLVIWSHIPAALENPAVGLIRYMTSTENLLRQFVATGLIPARLEALNIIERDHLYAPLVQSLKTGRAFKRTPLWGLVEERLLEAMDNIWHRLFSDPRPDIEQIIRGALTIPEERLNLTLSQ